MDLLFTTAFPWLLTRPRVTRNMSFAYAIPVTTTKEFSRWWYFSLSIKRQCYHSIN